MSFRVLVVGGTGQVGSGLVRALLAASSCTEVVMVNRRTIPLAADARLRQVIMDITTRGSGRADFWSEDRRLRLGAWVHSFADRGLHWSQTTSPPASVFH
jgi:nucleoside-diphosphate-sugar epimerase